MFHTLQIVSDFKFKSITENYKSLTQLEVLLTFVVSPMDYLSTYEQCGTRDSCLIKINLSEKAP